MAFDRSTVLELSSDVGIEIIDAACIAVTCRGIRRPCGPHALAILHAFRTPSSLGAALDALGALARGPADWIELTATLQKLVDTGALRALDCPPPNIAATHLLHFETQGEHIVMLDDRARTDALVRAVREAVRPDDIVLDIGTGTGVLAITAAHAGAKHVYAIEASRFVEMTKRVVAANGLQDRITVIHGYSTGVVLPEPATLLVTEIIGSEAFEENALLVNWDARRRLLAPNARILPQALRLFAMAVDIPEEVWAEEIFTSDATARWTEWYGADFSGLQHFDRGTRFFVHRPKLRTWRPISDPVTLGEVDFHSNALTVDFRAEIGVTQSSERFGIVTFFELSLAPSVTLSQDPRTAPNTRDWPCPVWVTPPTAPIARGDRLVVRYRRTESSLLSYERR